MYQTHEFAICEYEGTFVLILGDFVSFIRFIG